MFWKLSPSYFTHQTQQRWEIRWIRSTSPSMECRTWWAWPSTPTTASPPMSGRLPASLGPRWRLWINSDKLAKFRDAKVKVAELNLWQGIPQQNQLRCLHCNSSLILTSFKLSSTSDDKVSCNEGGCGACIVTVDKGDGQPVRSVNAVSWKYKAIVNTKRLQ